MTALKATLLDDDSFKLLAIPFSGPIPLPTAPRGADMDGEWFDETTDIKAGWLKSRDVDFHHGKDDLGLMNPKGYDQYEQPPATGREVIGRAVDPEMDEEGWWVKVWLDRGARRLGLIKRLAERGGQLFGSSESVGPLIKRNAKSGHIDVWPYWRQTLSTSPQNTHSVIRSLKAALEPAGGDVYASVTPAFWADISEQLDLIADLRRTSLGGDGAAKAEGDSADDGYADVLRHMVERADAILTADRQEGAPMGDYRSGPIRTG